MASKFKLKDVDFITEIDDEILFIEYKNSNIPNARRPEAMYQKKKSEPQKVYGYTSYFSGDFNTIRTIFN
ncbi:MAG: hypothetical protein MR593_00780 [Intestinibacter sp.]|nr:hypothetical protein [Intestinibacter sp.]